MQTRFTLEQLTDSAFRESDKILRTCVHCGFCTATCPTYILLGDELDSPRGRIYLIKQMLEDGGVPDGSVVKHIDRCLSCLSCMTTCPSGVHYMHLVDHARAHIEETFARSWPDRAVRAALAVVLPRPGLFRWGLLAGSVVRPLRRWLPPGKVTERLRSMLDLMPDTVPSPSAMDRPQEIKAAGQRRGRVALLTGCAQQVLAPQINEATIRLLQRHGFDVVVAAGVGCCGALNHHMGQERPALQKVKANVDAWTRELEAGGLDAIVINASGCGTTVKDYGFMLRDDPAYAQKAARISSLTRDISEFMAAAGLQSPVRPTDLVVAYHAACSLQHGQQIRREPKQLLADAGFIVSEPAEAHICCGSAGTYNMLQPEIAARLRERKIDHLEQLKADVIATGNIGCMTQLAAAAVPVVHTAELLDWATGGPMPRALNGRVNGIDRHAPAGTAPARALEGAAAAGH